VQQPGVEQHFHERADTTDRDQFRHEVLAARPEVGEHRHACADADEVIQVQRHARGIRDRQKMQDGVRRAAERDRDRDRVFERLAREDVGRLDAPRQQFENGRARAPAVFAPWPH
jgi:hypothetical protein